MDSDKGSGPTKSTNELAAALPPDPGILDTALDHQLEYYLAKYNEGHPAALSDAMKFCEEHGLFARDDLTAELKQLVQSVSDLNAQPADRTRRKKPKGNPTRSRKGRPATPDIHLKRYQEIEAYRDEQAAKGNYVSLPAACLVVGGGAEEAYRKSYEKVVSGNLYKNYYGSDYEDPDNNAT